MRAMRWLLLGALIAPYAGAQSTATSALQPMPRALETALALSAAPPHLSATAWLPVFVDVAQMRAHGDTPRTVYDSVTRRFADGRYHAPSRAGVSYMLAPVMRTFVADSSRAPTTMVAPHYMFYAPNVTDADIGGQRSGDGPFTLSTGPHGLIFLGAGATKKEEILSQSRDLLAALCSYRSVLCVRKAPGHAGR
jgi:hypothetical protein